MDLRLNPDKNIRLYYLSEFFAGLQFIIPIWVTFQHQFLTFTQMSLITALRFFISIILELPTGAFADLLGRRLSVIVGYLTQVLGLAVMGLATNGWQILAGLVLIGIGEAFFSGAKVALVYDNLKSSNKEHLFAKIRANGVLAGQFGIIASSIFAGYLFNIIKGLPYFMQGLGLIIASFMVSAMSEEKQNFKYIDLKAYYQQTVLGIKEVFKNDFTQNLSIFYIMVGGLSWSWQSYFNQIYASDIGYNEVEKGWLFAIIRFLNVILIIRIFHAEKYISKKNMFLFFPALMLFSSLPAIIPFKPLGTMLLFTMTLSSTLRFVVLDAYVNKEFVSHLRATALSALNMFVRIIYIVVVAVSGPLLDRFPTGFTYFLMGLLILVFILPKGILLSKHRQLAFTPTPQNLPES